MLLYNPNFQNFDFFLPSYNPFNERSSVGLLELRIYSLAINHIDFQCTIVLMTSLRRHSLH